MKRLIGLLIAIGFLGALFVKAQEVQPDNEITIDLGKGVKLEMVLIPPGKFKMGSTKADIQKAIRRDSFYKGKKEKEIKALIEDSFNNERQHEVTITKPYYMGKYEVTQEQWEAVIGSNPSAKTKGPKFPVTHVSWEDCQEFIKKLNALTKGGYRLPTEAVWEYACRGNPKLATAYSFGDKIAPKDLNYYDSNVGTPVAVGSYKPNSFGLYDMHGNVWEWCEDWHAVYNAEAVTDPVGPATGEFRILRGGSFLSYVSEGRSAARHTFGQSFRIADYGFRLAKTK